MKNKEELERISEALDKLDKNYFHTHISYDFYNNLTWSVYYANMNNKKYFSMKNKPILNSKYNTIEDIEKLDKEFRKIKKEADLNISLDKFDLYVDVFRVHSNIMDTMNKGFQIIGYSLMIFMIIMFITKIDTKIFMTLGTSLLLSLVIQFLEHCYIQDNIEKTINELHSTEKKRLIKVYLKDNEMRGLKNEFAKKDRKKFIEENKEYRPKRKRI